MAPVLCDGEVVRVRADVPPRIGDLVVARAAAALTVHRLVAVSGAALVLRGDNAPRCDAPIEREQLIGRVVAVEGTRQRTRRLDRPGIRALGVATAAYGRVQGALGRGPRPALVPRIVRRVAQGVLAGEEAEQAFVLLLARCTVSPTAAQRASELAKRGLDWDRVVQLALLGQVWPLLWAGLQQIDDEACVPRTARDRLNALRLAGMVRGRKMEDLLVRTLACLAGEGIAVMGHKGVALTTSVFRDPALHVSGDIDLSVADEDHARASRLTHAIRQPLLDSNPDRRDPGGFHIELDRSAHHDLDPTLHGGGRWRAGPLDWAAIWSESRVVQVHGQPMHVPCPADLVLGLISNAVRRGFTPVRLVSDVAEAIRHFGDGIDWFRVEGAVRDSRLDRRSWIALELAADWFDVEVPPCLLEPPPDLRPAVYEWLILERKRRQPFCRVPSRVLWAGSSRGAAAVAYGLLRARIHRSRAARRASPAWPTGGEAAP